MTDTTKTEALRLAGLLEQGYDSLEHVLIPSAAELRRLSAVEAERDRLAAKCEALRAAAAMSEEALRLLVKHSTDEFASSMAASAVNAITAAIGGKE